MIQISRFADIESLNAVGYILAHIPDICHLRRCEIFPAGVKNAKKDCFDQISGMLGIASTLAHNSYKELQNLKT